MLDIAAPGAPQMWSAGEVCSASADDGDYFLLVETLDVSRRPGHRLHPAPHRWHDSRRRHRSRLGQLLPGHALPLDCGG
jgi:hypothetical protein